MFGVMQGGVAFRTLWAVLLWPDSVHVLHEVGTVPGPDLRQGDLICVKVDLVRLGRVFSAGSTSGAAWSSTLLGPECTMLSQTASVCREMRPVLCLVVLLPSWEKRPAMLSS